MDENCIGNIGKSEFNYAMSLTYATNVSADKYIGDYATQLPPPFTMNVTYLINVSTEKSIAHYFYTPDSEG